MTTTVSIEKCSEYQFDSVYTSLKKLIKDVPPPDVTGKTVLLKPNNVGRQLLAKLNIVFTQNVVVIFLVVVLV